MSRERARRRAQRLAEAERVRIIREQSAARRRRRRQLLRRLTSWLPGRRRTGRLFARRTRAQRASVVTFSLVALGLIWWLVDDAALRLALIVLLPLALPAAVVIALDRRT